jgi:Leucine-rich repeat (LRR) protein
MNIKDLPLEIIQYIIDNILDFKTFSNIQSIFEKHDIVYNVDFNGYNQMDYLTKCKFKLIKNNITLDEQNRLNTYNCRLLQNNSQYLQILELENNKLGENIIFLEQLTNLTTLNLHNCGINENIKCLEKMTNLTTLKISNNYIGAYANNYVGLYSNDISPLNKLTKLTTLNLSYNQMVSHIIKDQLYDLTNLQVLSLNGNALSDDIFIAVNKFTKLHTLYLNDNNIVNVYNNNLKKLSVADNMINNISYLITMTNLVELNISHNLFDNVDIYKVKEALKSTKVII